MLQNKKAQGLSLNVIIVATLALIVFVVLVIIFTKTDRLKPPFNPNESVCLQYCDDYKKSLNWFDAPKKLAKYCGIKVGINDNYNFVVDGKRYINRLDHSCWNWRPMTREERFQYLYQDCDYYGATSDSVLFCLNDKEVPKLTQAD